MKKIFLVSVLSMLFASSSFAQTEAYLLDGNNSVVKNGFGQCWNVSGIKKPLEECGDKLNKIEAEIPVKSLIETKTIGVLIKVDKVTPPEIVHHNIIVSSSILFKFDSSKLSNLGKKELDTKVVTLNPVKIDIAGHTDSIGTDKYNMVLSQRRANAVKYYLVEKGMASKIITAEGFGESKLLCKETTKECNIKNRRVEIKVEATELKVENK